MERKQPSQWERRMVGRIVRRLMWGNRRGKSWAVPDHLKHEVVTFGGNTGAVLSGRYFPNNRAKGVVVLCHPDRRYGQHWFIQEGWIPFLLEAGFEVLTFDFAPFGASRGGSTYLHEDVLGACQFARERSRHLPLHVVGLSIGAFAAVNASPLVEAESLIVESPYPSFNSWYGRSPLRWGMEFFDVIFPRTAAMIQADNNIAQARVKRILIAGIRDDPVTRYELTEAVAAHAPADRTRRFDVAGIPHLGMFRASSRYRELILETLGAQHVAVELRN